MIAKPPSSAPCWRRVSDALQAATAEAHPAPASCRSRRRICTCTWCRASHDADVTGFDVFQLQARAKSGAVAAAADDACRAVVEACVRTAAARPPPSWQ